VPPQGKMEMVLHQTPPLSLITTGPVQGEIHNFLHSLQPSLTHLRETFLQQGILIYRYLKALAFALEKSQKELFQELILEGHFSKFNAWSVRQGLKAIVAFESMSKTCHDWF
jgi:hypothetical protein